MSGPRIARPKRNRYGVTAAFWLDAEDDDEARVLVGNFIDSFPDQVDGRNADVLLQDVELEEEDVEVEDE